ERTGKIVYFPSCINQAMGPSSNQKAMDSLVNVTLRVLNRAGFQVIFPENMNHLCCGMPWESKGFFEIANKKCEELERELLTSSCNGKYPVLCDTSPCIYRMRKQMSKKLDLYEPVEFIHDFLLDKLDIKKQEGKMAFHVTCSSIKMNLEEKFKKLAEICVEQPVFPEQVGCCGFAGDKGFSVPELNEWALRNLKKEIGECRSGISNSRTCEIGLSNISGISYQSIFYLINQCTKEELIQNDQGTSRVNL
ncbi:MAG: (Fe-S)-binding protein, partial [Bacteroidota bacterium]